jgi:hypothetical protein
VVINIDDDKYAYDISFAIILHCQATLLHYCASCLLFCSLFLFFILYSQLVAAAEEFHKEAMIQCKSLEIIDSNAAANTNASDSSSSSSGTACMTSTVDVVSVPVTSIDSSASTSVVAGDKPNKPNNSTFTSTNSRDTVTRKSQDKTTKKKSKMFTVCVRLGQEPQFLVLGKRYEAYSLHIVMNDITPLC